MLDFVSLGGVKGIRRAFLLKYNKASFEDDRSINMRNQMEWVLETEGINLKAVIGMDGVDYKRTYSNSCVEIFNVLGIEAAHAAILKELRDVIEWDGSYINYRHLTLFCDLMTHWGTLTALTRHGFNTGASKRCSPRRRWKLFWKQQQWARRMVVVRLLYVGKQLEDDRTLRDYYVQKRLNFETFQNTDETGRRHVNMLPSSPPANIYTQNERIAYKPQQKTLRTKISHDLLLDVIVRVSAQGHRWCEKYSPELQQEIKLSGTNYRSRPVDIGVTKSWES
ncbi:hypothetical protein B0H13DRAFT_2291364 [Mycena leptocephala]|nr:hypothetical protein B0H13DRAFT_2291364 [Mycena leptocephala]